MNDETRVWVIRRPRKKKTAYDLRWIDPSGGGWRSKCVGTDERQARSEAARLEVQLLDGTYRDIRRIPWADFVREHVATKSGKSNRAETKAALTEFGMMLKPRAPMDVRLGMVESFVGRLRDKGNAPATIEKKCTYIRHALKMAVRRGYAAVCAMDGLSLEKTPRGVLRILKATEEPLLLASGRELRGFQMETFVRFALTTWGRLGEVTKLLWDDVNFDDASVLFRSTKSHEHRWVPIDPRTGLLDVLRQLQVQTLQDGGPFVQYRSKSSTHRRRWQAIVQAAGIPTITVHDLRRTGITRALLAGVPPITVQRLAGQADIKTTMRFYAEVSKQDLRDGMARVTRSVG